MISAPAIYCIRHTASGRCYVGQATRVDRRWKFHRYQLRRGKHHCAFLQRTWNKYGETAFEFEIVEQCQVDELTAREQYWMDRLNSVFNTARAAGSTLGTKRSPASCKRLSDARKRTHSDPEFRRRMSEIKTRVAADPAVRQRISEATKAAMNTPEMKAKMAAAMAPVYADPEWRRKQSEAKRGRSLSAEYRQKIADGAARRGYRHSPEMRARLAEAAREREHRRAMQNPIIFEGQRTTLRALVDRFGLPYRAVWKRLKRGLTIEAALGVILPTNGSATSILRIT